MIAAITSPAPAIGGIAAGDTNDAASMKRSPVAESASISRTRCVDRHRRLVLQPVARPDLTDVDMRGPGGHAHHVTRPARPVPGRADHA